MIEKTSVAVVAPVSAGRASYVDWPAILGGAFVGSAIAFLFSAFGAALGLTLVSPFRGESVPPIGFILAIGLWVLWVAGMSFMAAGYVAGRLRRRLNDATEHEVEMRDGLHGAITWGVATLVGAGLLALGVYGTGNIATRGAQAAANAPTTSATAADVATPGTRGTPDEGSYALVVERMFGPGDELTKPGTEMARRTSTRVLAASAAEGKMADNDRAYLVKLVATRSGIPETEAQARVDQAHKEAVAAVQKAKEAANTARKIGIVSAFILAASLLVGAAAAWWAAGRGGHDRDEQTVFAWARWR